MKRQYNNDPGILNNSDELLNLQILKSNKTGKLYAQYILHGTNDEYDGLWRMTAEIFPEEFDDIKTRLLEISEAEDD
jgi:hypothetical protein